MKRLDPAINDKHRIKYPCTTEKRQQEEFKSYRRRTEMQEGKGNKGETPLRFSH